MWWLWLVLMVAVAGYFIYRTDKKIKATFEDKFNPREWELPRSVELTAEIKPQAVITSTVNVKLEYTKKLSIFSDSQRPIFNVLQQALAGEYNLLANINVADVLSVNANNNSLAVQTATKNIAAKKFNFLVCDKTEVKSVCAIVLGDTLEPFLVNACEDAQLPLVRFKIQASYDISIIRTSLLNALGRSENAVVPNYESALDIADDSVAPVEQKVDVVAAQNPQEAISDNGIKLELCPTCSSVMLKRKAKNGASAGKLFWICSTYPKCRGMLPVK